MTELQQKMHEAVDKVMDELNYLNEFLLEDKVVIEKQDDMGLADDEGNPLPVIVYNHRLMAHPGLADNREDVIFNLELIVQYPGTRDEPPVEDYRDLDTGIPANEITSRIVVDNFANAVNTMIAERRAGMGMDAPTPDTPW